MLGDLLGVLGSSLRLVVWALPTIRYPRRIHLLLSVWRVSAVRQSPFLLLTACVLLRSLAPFDSVCLQPALSDHSVPSGPLDVALPHNPRPSHHGRASSTQVASSDR